MNEDERVILTTEQAITMLPDGDRIHTFRSVGPTIIGADHDREDILDSIKNNEVELSGSMATGMGHGMCLIDQIGPLFIETKKNPKEGEPCNHPGCLSHVTHPCERCGRTAGRNKIL